MTIDTSGHPVDPLFGPYIAPTGPLVKGCKNQLVKVREDVPTNEEVLKSLAQARNLQWKVVGARVIGFLGSIALGAITGVAVAGVLVTPAGWALAGAAVFIGLAGSYHYGGPKAFLTTLLLSVAGFVTAMVPVAIIILKSLCFVAFPPGPPVGVGALVGLYIMRVIDKLACRNVSNAIKKNDIKLAKQLIGDGTFLNYYSWHYPQELPPLAVAITLGKTEIVPLLLKAGASIEWETETALGFALHYAQPDCLKIILQHIQAKGPLQPEERELIKEFLGMPSGKSEPMPSRFPALQNRALFMDIVFTLNRLNFFENCSEMEAGGFYLSITREIASFPNPAGHQYRKRLLTETNWVKAADFETYPLLRNARKELELETNVKQRQQALLINKDRFSKDCFLSDGRTTYPCSSALLKGNSNYFKVLNWGDDTQNKFLSFKNTLYQNNIKDVVDHIHGKAPILEKEQLKNYFELHEFESQATNFAMLFDSSITQANQVHDDVFEKSISQFNRDTVLERMDEANLETVKQCIEFLYKRNASDLKSTDEVLAVAQLCRQIGVNPAIQAELGSRYFEIVLNRENGLASIPEAERTAIQTFGGLPVNYVNLEGLNLKGGSDDLEVLLSLISPQMPPKLDLTRVSSAQLAAITERFEAIFTRLSEEAVRVLP